MEAIAQQCNCVGCTGMGLAAAVPHKLPHGSSYAQRRPMGGGKFAIEADRATPGTIDVRP